MNLCYGNKGRQIDSIEESGKTAVFERQYYSHFLNVALSLDIQHFFQEKLIPTIIDSSKFEVTVANIMNYVRQYKVIFHKSPNLF